MTFAAAERVEGDEMLAELREGETDLGSTAKAFQAVRAATPEERSERLVT